ncbi:MAG: T9SS type A sorting domain-containing protein, partial [Chitinophagaceae bacterium]|nr:T9SS type A sorting domain-containing protein [Chitinophagaceae bacterium]
INTGGASKDKPRANGNVLITTSFRVQVTGNYGDTIVLGAGSIKFKTSSSSSSGSTTTYNATQFKILITRNDPICATSVGRNFVAEAGGTFDSGTVQNRATAPTYAIVGYTYVPNVGSAMALNDGYYAILNNLSPWASTYQNAERLNNCTTPTGGPPPVPAACANRMFNGHWDIIGDHTGAATSAGNPPVASGTKGGYMLVVNADYVTTEAYRQTISGLCANTSYEFSLWVKNVCKTCGADSSGTAKYTPGVYPNLSFAIDDLDRYSSGQVDTTGWMKKGFLFRTGSSQTSITISVRNNASGGGGNDWAIDDIALVTCNPNLNLVPTGTAAVCYNQQVDVSSTVNSFFNNYVYYRFERSTDNGATWTTAGSGTGSPAATGGNYEYVAQLVPSFLADSAHHLNQYRFIVASTPANLAISDCSFQANTTIVVMVNNCSVVLSVRDSLTRLRREVTRTGKNAEIRRLVNPFHSNISFDLIAVRDAAARITVMDNYGRIIRRVQTKALKGYNHVILDQLSGLSQGTYILRVEIDNEIINRIVVKAN